MERVSRDDIRLLQSLSGAQMQRATDIVDATNRDALSIGGKRTITGVLWTASRFLDSSTTLIRWTFDFFRLDPDRNSVHFRTMLKALTVSAAKPKLGKLLDKAGGGQAVYLRRKDRLFRLEPVAEVEPIPHRPFGYFAVEEGDPMVALANSAPASFTPAQSP